MVHTPHSQCVLAVVWWFDIIYTRPPWPPSSKARWLDDPMAGFIRFLGRYILCLSFFIDSRWIHSFWRFCSILFDFVLFALTLLRISIDFHGFYGSVIVFYIFSFFTDYHGFHRFLWICIDCRGFLHDFNKFLLILLIIFDFYRSLWIMTDFQFFNWCPSMFIDFIRHPCRLVSGSA